MIVKKGTTDVTTYFKLIDPATGAPKTGLTITDLDATYVRDRAAASKADLTELAAVDSAHGDNKAIQIDATNCPGLYRVDWPDAAFATGVNRVQLCVNGAAIDPAYVEVELVNYDPADGVRLGLTALPNAAADAAGGLPISDAGALDLDAILADTNELQTDLHDGGRLDLLVDGIKTKTDYLPSANPGAANGLVICGTNAPILFTGSGNAFAAVSTGGNGAGMYVEGNTGGHGLHAKGGNGIAASGYYGQTAGTGAGFYGTMGPGMITSTVFATDAITAAAIAADAIGASELAADAASEIGTAVWATAARTLTAATNITSTGGTTVPQTGDAYAIVNNGTYGNSALNTTLGTIAEYIDTEIGTIITNIAALHNITAADVVTALLGDTTILPAGTVTFAQIIKILAARAAGDVKDKVGGGYSVFSPDNGTTEVFSFVASATTPYLDVTLA